MILINIFLPPPTVNDRLLLRFYRTMLQEEDLIIPPIVVTEFLKIAGKGASITTIETWVRSFVESRVRVESLSIRDCLEARRILCRYNDTPVVDALVATTAKRFRARILSDDPHFREIGLRTLWYE